MAFQNMMEGDCGGQNPLMKLGTHFTQDQAFRQDRANVLPSQFSEADIYVNEFLGERLSQNIQTFRMDDLAAEIRDMDFHSRNPINQAPNVAQLAPQDPHAIWTEEFLRAEKLGGIHAPALDPLETAELGQPVPEIGFERAVTNPRAGGSLAAAWAAAERETVNGGLSTASGWVDNYIAQRQDELGAIDLASAAPELESKKFWQKSEEGEEWPTEFGNASADKLVNQVVLEGYGTEDVEGDWDNIEQKEFWQKMQKMWLQISGTETTDSDAWQNEFSAFVDPFKEYQFEAENPMKECEDSFQEGLKKLKEQDLPSAVLCFEAAVQADAENALAWQYLGTTQAENEQDAFAIPALKRCLALQPDNLTALMTLAISYTNENYQSQACQMLNEWLQNNPKYRHLCGDVKPTNKVTTLLDNDYHNEIKELFIKAAKMNPVGEIDGDVQCALGVLFNLSNEIDKAVDCFKAALNASPNDFRMWNRLGATLANGNRSEEAVDAYYHALHLSPGFIRARYNLGIACINLKAYKEAVDHFLVALNQQAKGTGTRGEKGGMSDTIWGTMRLVMSLMNNTALLPAVEAKDLETLNREFAVK